MKKILAIETRLQLRDWPGIAFTLALPVLLLLLLGQIPHMSQPDPSLGGQRYVDTQLPAQMALLALLTLAFTSLPSVLVGYRERGVLRRMSVTPVPPSRLLAAQLLINLVVAVVATTLLITLGRLALGSAVPQQFAGFVLVFLLGTAALLAVGLVIAAVAPNAKVAPGLGSILMFPLMFVAGMWMPYETMPPVLRAISDYSIVGPFVQAMRDTWVGRAPELLDLGVMAAGLLIFGGLAVRLFRWE